MNKGEEEKLKVTAEALKKMDASAFRYHKMPFEEVLKRLNVD